LSLKDAIQQLFNDAKDIAQLIAPIAAVLGFLGLGIMYMGSSWPLIGDWKRDNPKAANQVVLGLLFVIAAGSITTIISFS
jgi:phage-related minor tail protein